MSKNSLKFAELMGGIRHAIASRLVPLTYDRGVGGLRPSAKFARDYLGEDLRVAEIGVAIGDNAVEMLENMPIKELYLIDPYEVYTGNAGQVIDHRWMRGAVKERFTVYGDRVTLIFKHSGDALDEIPNDLDYIYIDGDHSYPVVLSDIKNYYKKVRQRGILAGHDYITRLRGVNRAVDQFETEERVRIYKRRSDWWLIKQ